MTIRLLLPVFLVLLQSGLAVAHAHNHANLASHTRTPHLHVHDLFDLFGSDHDDEDGDDHDTDAVDVSDMALSAAPPPAVDVVLFDLATVTLEPAFGDCAESSFPVGLPPSTAGPHRPLYLILCTLTI
jgi:hypothetical protein